ncbi:MAG: CerR family C-terminal domain-containing protein [bacterium]|nr:CerR family C-terminal domain-containing protein [bacterium]
MSAESAKTRLLLAAGPIFAEKGYDGATVREICESAGVNLASVNYHFGDKERLYLETIKLAHRLREQQTPLREFPPNTPGDERLRAFVATMLTRMLSEDCQPWQNRIMMREILTPSDACRELVEEQFRPQFEWLLDVISEIAPADTARTVCRRHAFSIIGQCVHFKLAGQLIDLLTPPEDIATQRDVPLLTNHIVNMTLAALKIHEPQYEAASHEPH